VVEDIQAVGQGVVACTGLGEAVFVSDRSAASSAAAIDTGPPSRASTRIQRCVRRMACSSRIIDGSSS
jgi:hypothetical protein